MIKDIKYLAAYSIPLSLFIGIHNLGYWTFMPPIYAFVCIPILETLLPQDTLNLNTEQQTSKLKNPVFDWLLYLNIPIVFALLFLTFKTVASFPLTSSEIVGLMVSLGIVLGTNGINVGHELGHRSKSKERFLGKVLLTPALYMHFYIEHNFGHHLHAATKEDPATAKYNQSVYSFWWTSIIRQYRNAWTIQLRLLKQQQLPLYSLKSDMLWYSVIQGMYLLIIFITFDLKIVGFAMGAALFGILLLETVNYIEHYGLLRLITKSGRYERVREIHSWNSNHVVGRIVLYELTRHSDHHYKSHKKYQILECHEDSPQMPYGYPTSMVLALFPPLWFKIMNPRVPEIMKPNLKST